MNIRSRIEKLERGGGDGRLDPEELVKALQRGRERSLRGEVIDDKESDARLLEWARAGNKLAIAMLEGRKRVREWRPNADN